MKRFKCTVCGYIHEGDEAPALPPENTPAVDFAAVYPPGIPFIGPGDLWDKERLAFARRALQLGLDVVGI